MHASILSLIHIFPLSVLNKALITELAELTKERPGSTELYFKVRDEDSKMTVDLISRPVKLSVGRELIKMCIRDSQYIGTGCE